MQTLTSERPTSLPGVMLRMASPMDREFLYQVFASTQDVIREAMLRGSGFSPEFVEEHFRTQFDWQSRHYQSHYPDIRFDVVLVDGRPAGRLYTDRSRIDIRVVDIALLPAYRGRGIGEALLRDICAEAAGTGRFVSIHVEHQNPRALAFYKAQGFVDASARSEAPGSHWYLEWRPPVPQKRTFLMG